MKKFLFSMFLAVLSTVSWGQAQINTKKVKISDFTHKITKVVLTGNQFLDVNFQDEIAARWRISPYEFCTSAEFESLKGSDQYYFLLNTKGQFKDEDSPGLMYLTLVKGGEGAAKGLGGMLEVVSLPYAAAEDPSGREFVFLPAMLEIIQTYTLDSMEKDLGAYGGLSNYSKNMPKAKDMTIVFAEDDLSALITPEIRKLYFDDSIICTDESTVDTYMMDNAPNTLVSYTLVPAKPESGSYCYKMLIDTETYQLYYFRKHRIGKKLKAGFLPDDIRNITINRRVERKATVK